MIFKTDCDFVTRVNAKCEGTTFSLVFRWGNFY